MYREIAAKTLIGKGKLNLLMREELNVNANISKTLGCWIINLNFQAEENDRKIKLKGSYDIQLWYASDNDQKSAVFNKTLEFESDVMVSYRDLKTLDDQLFIKTYVSKYPTCTAMELDSNGNVKITIDSLFMIDVFAEAILVVNCADDYVEDISLDEEIMMNVNPNYLEGK